MDQQNEAERRHTCFLRAGSRFERAARTLPRWHRELAACLQSTENGPEEARCMDVKGMEKRE